jgi:hypothetical protein
MEFHNPQLLPLIPERLRREKHVFEPHDTRFRAAARLLQALWRERRDLPAGHHISQTGARRRLGSALAIEAARTGANFLSPEIFGQARCDLAYREPGALIDAERMWGNMLASTPLAFNLLAPLKTDQPLARRVFAKLAPDAMKRVAHLQFEHSPGRGDLTFTNDGTAFDAFISGRAPDGGRTFIAIEIKYSESMTEPEARLRPRYNELSRSSGLYAEPDDEALRGNPMQQLWRQHLLAQSMIDCGLYDSGVFMLIAPRQNREVQRAARRYANRLAADNTKVQFLNVELEHAFEALRTAGAADHANALYDRYCDFGPVHERVRAACFNTPRRKRSGRVTTRTRRTSTTPPTPRAALTRG